MLSLPPPGMRDNRDVNQGVESRQMHRDQSHQDREDMVPGVCTAKMRHNGLIFHRFCRFQPTTRLARVNRIPGGILVCSVSIRRAQTLPVLHARVGAFLIPNHDSIVPLSANAILYVEIRILRAEPPGMAPSRSLRLPTVGSHAERTLTPPTYDYAVFLESCAPA